MDSQKIREEKSSRAVEKEMGERRLVVVYGFIWRSEDVIRVQALSHTSQLYAD